MVEKRRRGKKKRKKKRETLFYRLKDFPSRVTGRLIGTFFIYIFPLSGGKEIGLPYNHKNLPKNLMYFAGKYSQLFSKILTLAKNDWFYMILSYWLHYGMAQEKVLKLIIFSLSHVVFGCFWVLFFFCI